MHSTIPVSMEQLSSLNLKLFRALGYNETEAAFASGVLTETDRRGVDTHGIARLTFYCRSVLSGRVNKDAKLTLLRDDPPFVMVDAGRGLGVIMAPQAVDLAIQKAREHGICVMGIQNSGHFGAAGYYTAKCVDAGFIALVCSNSGPTMAPAGGKVSVLGNSPWSMAMPGGKRYPDPVMFDMACSEVARGKCETAQREGAQVPLGWGIDSSGAPSTDPTAILQGGSLLPFGGIKGYCIALLLETLSSMLTFASTGKETGDANARPGTGHFVLLMDPARFGDLDAYQEGMDAYIDKVKNAPLAEGAAEILIPGELEARSIRRRTTYGMDLDEEIASSIAALAREIGLLTENQGFEALLS
ncbi:MAG: Ldh family oxidoreductase [Clostridiales bacterium]|nr:Ldh family oxidoreductase [Clostridiales bacterium]